MSTKDLSVQSTQLMSRFFNRFDSELRNRWQTEWGNKSLLHGQSPMANAVRLDGNDYLSLSGYPTIVQAQIDALKKSVHQVVQSGTFHHNDHPSRQLERNLATWLGFDDTMLCQSGYMANIGLLQAIADDQTTVYIDMQAHMSLWDGALAAKAMIRAFRHNDPEHLQKQIAKHGSGLVIVDSVYSTTGALCALQDILAICEETDCRILVDESHTLGTHGPQGKGLCAALNVSHRVDFITASLAKAFSARAGFFTLPRLNKNYQNHKAAMRCFMSYSNHPHVFSSSLLGHEIAALSETLTVVKEADQARARLAYNTCFTRNQLTLLGYPIAHGSEQIIALEAGAESNTMVLRDALEREAIFGAVFCAPATARNRSMVRLTLNADLTELELRHIVATCEYILPTVKPTEWPIANKQKKHTLNHQNPLAGSLWFDSNTQPPASLQTSSEFCDHYQQEIVPNKLTVTHADHLN